MKAILKATLTNHGITVGDSTYCYGIPWNGFPSPRIPGAVFKVTVEFLGTDPKVKPELHAWWPTSAMAGLCNSPGEILKKIKECKSALRKIRDRKERQWWSGRMKLLKTDLESIATAKKNHAAAVRLWRKHLIK